MKRGRIIAAVILALVVATVLAVGPVRVWDWVTLRTVEERFPNGTLQCRYKVRLWEHPEGEGRMNFRERYEEWYSNGERAVEFLGAGPGCLHGRLFARSWNQDGRLNSCLTYLQGEPYEGTEGSYPSDKVNPFQHRYSAGELVESRTSPPWFTEEEILQSVEGLEE